MIRPTLRLRRHRGAQPGPDDEAELVEIDPGELSGLFATPGWLRDLGLTAWLLFGVVAALAGAVVILGLTKTIVGPLITAGIIASVASPIVDWLERRSVPRAAGAVIVFLALILLSVVLILAVIGGITSQADALSQHLHSAAGKIEGWIKDLGVNDDDRRARQPGRELVDQRGREGAPRRRRPRNPDARSRWPCSCPSRS